MTVCDRQVALADRIILNKVDLVSAAELQHIRKKIKYALKSFLMLSLSYKFPDTSIVWHTCTRPTSRGSSHI